MDSINLHLDPILPHELFQLIYPPTTSPTTLPCPNLPAPLSLLSQLLLPIASRSNAHHHFPKTFSPISLDI